MNDGKLHFRCRPSRRLNRAIQNFRIVSKAQVPHQQIAPDSSIRFAPRDLGESTPGPNHRFEQTAGRAPIAKIEAVRNNAFDAQIVRKRAHDVVEALADKDDVIVRGHRFLQFFHAGLPEARLQEILKEFLTEQIQAIAADAAQHGVQQSRGEDAVRGVQKWPRDGEHAHGTAPPPALDEGLRVPREEADWPNGRQIEQAAFHAPEGRLAHCCIRLAPRCRQS